MTREWTPLEPGEIEHKFYCPSTMTGNPVSGGLMLVEELKGKTTHVEYVGSTFGFLPGQDDPVFPSTALFCNP
jgi:hypothetical protein